MQHKLPYQHTMWMTQIYSFEPGNPGSKDCILYNSFLVKFKTEIRLGGVMQAMVLVLEMEKQGEQISYAFKISGLMRYCLKKKGQVSHW